VTKFEEALPPMRLISGNNLNDRVDRVWMTNALRQIGPDGLVYWPFQINQLPGDDPKEATAVFPRRTLL
jgi:hypothetical protein